MNLADAYLLERGVTPQTVAQHGIEIDLGPLDEGRIISRLAQGCVPVWKLASELLWFPVRKATGSVISWIARPLPTLTGGPKFVTPVGGTAPPFVPKRAYGITAGAPLIITEGPVKSLVCDQAGIAAIGINGVWCASAKLPNDKLVLRQEIHGLDVRGRKVYIAFDADSAIKADVRHAMIRLFFMLSAAGAEVYQLTSWDIAEGKGIDDYLVGQASQGTPQTCLKMLITDAAPFIDTIHKDKVDLDAVSGELAKVELSHLFRFQLCGELAGRLKVPVDELRKIGSEPPKPKGISFDTTPKPWPDQVNGEDLLHELSAIIRQHLIIDDPALTAATLWTVLTYLVDVVDTLPLLAITSPERRCGKTRLLALLRRLTKRPLPTSNISPAALSRAIEKFFPTLIVDEADSAFEDNDELRCLFNSGHTRDTAFVLRAERENGDVLSFSTWAPKAIALIGKLPSTLADRSILVGMRRRSKNEKILSLRKTSPTQFEKLQQRLVRWTDDNKVAIAATDPKLPEYLNDRAADNWFPLLAIAEIAGPDWRNLALQAMRAMNQADSDDDSVITVLLISLRKVFRASRAAFIPTNDILKILNADEEAPWADWRQGKGLSAEKLRRFLVGFGVRSTQQQISNVRNRGYTWATLRPVFERYL